MSAIQDEISGEVKQQQRSPDGVAQSLIRVNQLGYKLPANMSVVVNRTMSRSYANLDKYTSGGKVIVTFNTGSTFVWGRNSYLTFEIKTVGAAATANFGTGSALNLIDSCTIFSQSGTELERTEGCNLHSKNFDRYMYSQDWINNLGSVMGYGSTEKSAAGDTVPVVISNTVSRFCIPLNHLAGIFGTSVLLPSMLAGGMRLEIKLAPYEQALTEVNATLTGYEITNATVQLDTLQLADSIQKSLMMSAAQNGLEVYYETWDRTRSNQTSSKANVTIRKSVSRALSAFAVTRLTNDTVDKTKDSMLSEIGSELTGQFWRLGALTFPQQKLENVEEQYLYAQRAFQKVQSPFKMNSVSLSDFIGVAAGGEAIAAVTLERSNVLELSGSVINNSRSLQLELDYATAKSRDVDIFLHYVQLARVFINNVLVKE